MVDTAGLAGVGNEVTGVTRTATGSIPGVGSLWKPSLPTTMGGARAARGGALAIELVGATHDRSIGLICIGAMVLVLSSVSHVR